MLRANAYGHGLEQVTEAIDGFNAPYLAVANLAEATRVRQVSDRPVLILGRVHPSSLPYLGEEDRLAFCVQSPEEISALGESDKNFSLHLDLNTGLNRYGADLGEIDGLIRQIASYPPFGIRRHNEPSGNYNRW